MTLRLKLPVTRTDTPTAGRALDPRLRQLLLDVLLEMHPLGATGREVQTRLLEFLKDHQ